MKHHSTDKLRPVAVKAIAASKSQVVTNAKVYAGNHTLTSLDNAIRTKEQAEHFMQQLRKH